MDLSVLLNPNLAYLLLVAGFLFAMLAIFSPGTGFLEIAALVSFVLAGWIIIYLPINWWALLILVIGVFPFLLAVRFSKKLYFLVISIIALIVGSVFIFDAPGWKPAVNPVLATIVSSLVAVFVWIVATKYLQVANQPPSHDLASLIGKVGEARSDIEDEGSVYVGGEMWTARSSQPISSGTRIKVIDRQGLVLIVEPDRPAS